MNWALRIDPGSHLPLKHYKHYSKGVPAMSFDLVRFVALL